MSRTLDGICTVSQNVPSGLTVSIYVSVNWVINCADYNDIIMGVMESQITSLTIVYSVVYLSADQRKHQNSAILVFVWGIHRRPVNSPHKGPVTWKMFPFDDGHHGRQWLHLFCNINWANIDDLFSGASFSVILIKIQTFFWRNFRMSNVKVYQFPGNRIVECEEMQVGEVKFWGMSCHKFHSQNLILGILFGVIFGRFFFSCTSNGWSLIFCILLWLILYNKHVTLVAITETNILVPYL